MSTQQSSVCVWFKGIVHLINFWYVLVYLKGIQDVGVFVFAVVSILIFLGQTVSAVKSDALALICDWSVSTLGPPPYGQVWKGGI